MTLNEAKTKFEEGKIVWSADQYYQWARYKKTGQLTPWPFSLAPSGEKFIVMCSGGEKQEAMPFSSMYRTQELAVGAWFDCVKDMGHRIEKPVVYWREEPMLEKVPGGWVVYSRLVVSTEIEQ